MKLRLLRVMFGDPEVYMTVNTRLVVFSRFKRMERTLYIEKENCIG
jgi:hypothetical protein